MDKGCAWFFTLSRSHIIPQKRTVVNPLEQNFCRSARTPFAVLHRQTLGMLKFVRHGTFAAFASAPVNGRATPLGAPKLHRNNPPRTRAPRSCKRGTLRAAFSKSAQTVPTVVHGNFDVSFPVARLLPHRPAAEAPLRACICHEPQAHSSGACALPIRSSGVLGNYARAPPRFTGVFGKRTRAPTRRLYKIGVL